MDNPYAPPKSAVVENELAWGGTIRLYSPNQVAAGAFLGGPIGLVYFLKANFRTLGDEKREKNTLVYGAIYVMALTLLLPLLPDKVPSAPINLAYILIARYFADRYQMRKQAIADSQAHDFHSNWRVVGFGLLCGAASAVLIIGFALLLVYAGLLPSWAQ